MLSSESLASDDSGEVVETLVNVANDSPHLERKSTLERLLILLG